MADLTKGTVLENTYEIVEEIGSGGGGIVFRAKHLRLQTDVVVKKIKEEVRGKVRSRQEADILKGLKHPFLPRVYDFIETEDAVYTVMDFIHGTNLEEAVAHHGRYPQKQVKKWAEQLGEALAYLHDQKPPVIHSDIKPANIMLTEEGNICLIDFNISLAMGGTMESAVGISIGFSPPEQYRDPATYARITQNYTLQESFQKIGHETGTEISRPEETESRTEILPREQSGNRTAILNHRQTEDRTELLHREGVENGTELLEGEKTEDSTEISDREYINRDIPGISRAEREDRTKEVNHATDRNASYTKFMGRGIDARSDIYSLGVTLYFLLTGKQPAADFTQRISIYRAGVTVSEGFAVIIDRMMELPPEKRYRSGREFLKAIQNCHKLDRRYILMHRKQTCIQAAALACMMTGILFTAGGFYKIRQEKNSAYYTLIQEAKEAMSLHDFQEAWENLESAKEISQTRIDAYVEEIHSYYLNGNYEECIRLGMNYINTTPFLLESEEDYELYGDICYIVGNACYELEDYANARILFEDALKYNNRNGLYYRDYAITLARLGQAEKAEEQLAEGIRLGVAQDSVYMTQGEIASVRRQYEQAAEYLNQAIATTTDIQMKKRAVLLCADVYKAMGDEAIDEEIGLLSRYRNQFEDMDNLVISEYLAEAYVRKAREDEAKANDYYQEALGLFHAIYESGYVTYQLQENMAILYENMGRFDEAEEMLHRMAESYPERYEIYKRLAFLEADIQQTKENQDRDYRRTREYYDLAKEKYSGKQQDMEMDMLENMMKELEDGGWL